MNSWKVEYSPGAEKILNKLDPKVVEHIFRRLEWLAEHFDEIDATPLHHDLKSFFKFRIGDWRIAYKPDHSHRVLWIHDLDRRDKIYKRT